MKATKNHSILILLTAVVVLLPLTTAGHSEQSRPTLITTEHHLPRGDDAFLLDNRAAWMTGSAAEQKLHIHFVDASLGYEMVPLD